MISSTGFPVRSTILSVWVIAGNWFWALYTVLTPKLNWSMLLIHRFPRSIDHDRHRRRTDTYTFRTAVIGVFSVCFSEQLAERSVVHVLVRWRSNVGEGTLGVDELVGDRVVGLITCEEDGDVVGVKALLGGVVQVFFPQSPSCRGRCAGQGASGQKSGRRRRRTGRSRKGGRWGQRGTLIMDGMRWRERLKDDLSQWGVTHHQQDGRLNSALYVPCSQVQLARVVICVRVLVDVLGVIVALLIGRHTVDVVGAVLVAIFAVIFCVWRCTLYNKCSTHFGRRMSEMNRQKDPQRHCRFRLFQRQWAGEEAHQQHYPISNFISKNITASLGMDLSQTPSECHMIHLLLFTFQEVCHPASSSQDWKSL